MTKLLTVTVVWYTIFLGAVLPNATFATPMAEREDEREHENNDSFQPDIVEHDAQVVPPDDVWTLSPSFYSTQSQQPLQESAIIATTMKKSKLCRPKCPIATSTATAKETAKETAARKPTNDDDDDDSSCHGEPMSPEIPRFLFAGQSNMEGWSNQAKQDLFNLTINIVNEKFHFELDNPGQTPSETQARLTKQTILKKLRKAIREAKGGKDKDGKQMGSVLREARLIYDMAGDTKAESLLNNHTILDPHPENVCSLSNPLYSPTVACEQPIGPTACGAKGRHYGPELVFGHLFHQLNTKYKHKKFGITKVSPSGSDIEEYLKDSTSTRKFWFSLRDNILADNGTIEAFFWFQGEGNHFPTTIAQDDYFTMLTDLVKDVRTEIFNAHRTHWGETGSPTATFGSYTDVPVVLCELGPWIGNGVSANRDGDPPGAVIRAQRQFVNGDENSILINTGTDDNPKKRLSKFYHFDALSQLVIGHRMALVSLFFRLSTINC
jgi:hypothetical protein